MRQENEFAFSEPVPLTLKINAKLHRSLLLRLRGVPHTHTQGKKKDFLMVTISICCGSELFLFWPQLNHSHCRLHGELNTSWTFNVSMGWKMPKPLCTKLSAPWVWTVYVELILSTYMETWLIIFTRARRVPKQGHSTVGGSSEMFERECQVTFYQWSAL